MTNIPSLPAEDLPSLSFIDRQISAELNSGIFLVFLMAIYSIAYSSTLYLYLTRKASQSRLVVIMMTVLFGLGMFQLGIEWGILKWQFVNAGQTKEKIFLSYYFIPAWCAVANAFALYGSFLLADMLLIWRCFNVWNRSLRAILIPCGFIVIECGFYITTIALRLTFNTQDLEEHQTLILNATQSALFFISATASMIATFLIAYRIHIARTNQDGSMKVLNSVADIVIQSGAVYSLTLLMSGIIAVLPANGPFGVGSIELFEAAQYASTVLPAVTGIAPTVMIARVAMLENGGRNDAAGAPYISGLRFRNTQGSDASDDLEDVVEPMRSSTISGDLHEADKEQ